jgi:hypothetical protein
MQFKSVACQRVSTNYKILEEATHHYQIGKGICHCCIFFHLSYLALLYMYILLLVLFAHPATCSKRLHRFSFCMLNDQPLAVS